MLEKYITESIKSSNVEYRVSKIESELRELQCIKLFKNLIKKQSNIDAFGGLQHMLADSSLEKHQGNYNTIIQDIQEGDNLNKEAVINFETQKILFLEDFYGITDLPIKTTKTGELYKTTQLRMSELIECLQEILEEKLQIDYDTIKNKTDLLKAYATVGAYHVYSEVKDKLHKY